jgi:hypothetical protein
MIIIAVLAAAELSLFAAQALWTTNAFVDSVKPGCSSHIAFSFFNTDG